MQKKNSNKMMDKMSRIDSDDVAKGAAGVAIAAGVVAAGAALSKKENRKKIGQAASSGMEAMQSMAVDLKDKAVEAYPQVQHQIANLNKGKSYKGRKASRKHER